MFQSLIMCAEYKLLDCVIRDRKYILRFRKLEAIIRLIQLKLTDDTLNSESQSQLYFQHKKCTYQK